MDGLGAVLGDIKRRAERGELSRLQRVGEEPDCDMCNDTGVVSARASGAHNIWQSATCPCQTERVQGENLRRAVVYSELPETLRLATFETFRPRQITKWWTMKHAAEMQDVVNAAMLFAVGETTSPWLALLGSLGWGKTHLACAIVNYRIDHPDLPPAKWVEAPDLLQRLRKTFNKTAETEGVSYDQLFDSYRDAPMLVLDDLGAHRDTDWAQEQFYLLLNFRYVRRLPTVITSNVPAAQIDPRVRDRLRDTGTGLSEIFALELPSYRTGKVER